MPAIKRIKTSYPVVFYIEGTSPATGKPEKIFYIRYRKAGKMIEEKAGWQYQYDMTPAKANRIRAEKIDGKKLTRQEVREAAAAVAWTVDRLWQEYLSYRPETKGLSTDNCRYNLYLKGSLGPREPKSIVQLDVDRLRINLGKIRKPQTVKHVLALLNRIVAFGVKKGLCPGLPFKTELPKVDNRKTGDLTPEQLADLLEAIAEDSNIQAANLMKMAPFTGMRRGELFKLQWRHVDFERGFIHIH